MSNNDIQYIISENIANAATIIADNAMSKIKTDQTIVATIQQADKEDLTKYYVSTGATKFYAYSDKDTRYKKNQQVYVLVPQGDYTQRKIILSALPSTVEEATATVSPSRLKDYIPVIESAAAANITSISYGNILPKPEDITNYIPLSLPAYVGDRKWDYYAINLIPQDKYEATEEQPNDFYLYLKFKDNTYVIITLNDLRGNINYLSPEIGYDFVYPANIVLGEGIQVCLVQGAKPMAFDITVSAGYSRSNTLINSGKMVIYNNINDEYVYNVNDIQDIKIQLAIFGEQYNIIATKYNPTNFISDIIVFRYVVGTESELGGTNWEEVGRFAYTTLSRVANSSWIGQDGIINLSEAALWVAGAETTKFKIYCKINDSVHQSFDIWSDVITFRNQAVDKSTTVVSGQKIKLSLKEGDNGIYNYYGLDNHFNHSDSKKKLNHTITVMTSSDEPLMSEGKYIDRVKSIVWEYPLMLTGIEVDTYQLRDKDAEGNDILDENGNPITKTYVKGYLTDTLYEDGLIATGNWGDVFYYHLKNTCYPNWTHNKVKCIVTFADGVEETAEIDLEFGGYKNLNTPYSLNIDIDNDNKYLTNGQILKLKTLFERVDGEAATLPQEGWIWEWVKDSPMIFCDEKGSVLPLPENASEDMIVGKYYVGNATDDIYITIGNTSEYIYYSSVIKLTIPKAQVNDIAQQDIITYLPIPFCYQNISGYNFAGPDRVIYDGINDMSYDNSNIILYHNNNVVDSTTIQIVNRNDLIQTSENIDKSSHQLRYIISYNDDNTTTIQNTKLVPVIGNTINSEAFVNIILIKDKEGSIIWEQPIITYRNLWTNENLYGWNGTAPWIDNNENNGGIYSPFIAAGGLNHDNTFSGVMLGKCLVSNNDQATYGLFGTQNGEPRFYLTENGEFFVGSASNGSKPYGITLNKSGYLEVKLNQFYLDVPHLKIDSDNKQIDIYSDSDNTILRARYGLIRDNIYGLDIYEGSLRIYGVPYQEGLGEEDCALYFKSIDDDKMECYLRGNILRNDIYAYEKNHYNTGYGYQDLKGTCEFNMRIGELPNVISIPFSNGGITETYLSGIYIKATNKHAKRDSVSASDVFDPSSYTTTNTYYTNGFLGGIAAASVGNINGVGISNYHVDRVYGNGSRIDKILAVQNTRSGTNTICQLKLCASQNNARLPINHDLSWPSDTAGIEISATAGYLSVYVYGTFYPEESGSDMRIKTNIEQFDERYEILFDSLIPTRYKYIRGTSGRYHTGFIAQEVCKALTIANLTTQDFAAVMLDNPGTEKECYYLRRDEFVALNTWQIQKLKARVTELENEIKELKQNEIYK